MYSWLSTTHQSTARNELGSILLARAGVTLSIYFYFYDSLYANTDLARSDPEPTFI
jgi:hypothetical protein